MIGQKTLVAIVHKLMIYDKFRQSKKSGVHERGKSRACFQNMLFKVIFSLKKYFQKTCSTTLTPPSAGLIKSGNRFEIPFT